MPWGLFQWSPDLVGWSSEMAPDGKLVWIGLSPHQVCHNILPWTSRGPNIWKDHPVIKWNQVMPLFLLFLCLQFFPFLLYLVQTQPLRHFAVNFGGIFTFWNIWYIWCQPHIIFPIIFDTFWNRIHNTWYSHLVTFLETS